MLLVDCEPFSQRSFPVNPKKRGAILLSLFFGAKCGYRPAILFRLAGLVFQIEQFPVRGGALSFQFHLPL